MSFFVYLDLFEDYVWRLGIPVILFLGLYLSVKSRFFQIFYFPKILRFFLQSFSRKNNEKRGHGPLHVFFASIGGAIGVGNIIVVCMSIEIGGPGALFWLWVTALLGMLVKYAEIYLGIKFRIANSEGSYDGGPIYYLQRVFKTRLVPTIVAIALCVYGVEVLMFKVIVDTATQSMMLNKEVVIFLLLAITLYIGAGGVKRVGFVSTMLVPVFLVIFMAMSSYILFVHRYEILPVLALVFKSAFSGHAALGGFAGATMSQALSQGIKRACYTGDIGVGYASMIHSETSLNSPGKQASFGIIGIFLDTFIVCTLAILLILVTGVWKEGIASSFMVQHALGKYFPYTDIFMAIFVFLLGLTSMIAFFCVGLKSAKFLSAKFGPSFYFIGSAFMFVLFSYADTSYAASLMATAGAILLILNLFGIFKLRKEIHFGFDEKN